MYTLYHCEGARSFRALWTLEELDLPYRLVMMPFPPRARMPDYKAVNPLGTVPALIDGDILMTESAAIAQYIATRAAPNPLVVAPDEPGYADYLNFISCGEATLTFPQTLFLRYARFEPPERRQPQVADDYMQWFLARLNGVAQLLGARAYLAADRFTVADISVGYALKLAEILGFGDRFPESITAYWQRLTQRPAYQNACAREAADRVEKPIF